MKNIDKTFRQKSIEKIWLPLTKTLIDANNVAMITSKNNDEEFVNHYYFLTSLLKPLYTKVMTEYELYRTAQLLIYIIEFNYGDPYAKSMNGLENVINKEININKMFDMIKKYWDVDINKELKKIEKNKK